MFKELILRVSECLKKNDLPYMIIGGQALLLYGEPRLTRDIDITLGAGTDRLKDLIVVINELSLKPIPVDFESFVKQTMVLPALDEPSGIRVDFIFSFTPYEIRAIERAKKVPIGDKEVSFTSAEDLIIHKVFAGRPRDIEDVRSVLLKNPSMDVDYIRRWLGEFDKAADKKDFLKTFEEILKGL